MPDTAAVRKCAGEVVAVETTDRVVAANGSGDDSVDRFAACAAAGTAAAVETGALCRATLAVDDVPGTELAAAGADADALDEADCCAATDFGRGLTGDLFLLRGAGLAAGASSDDGDSLSPCCPARETAEPGFGFAGLPLPLVLPLVPVGPVAPAASAPGVDAAL